MSATTAVPGTDERPGLVRAFVVGATVGFVAVFSLFAGATLLLGLGVGPAIGIGLFTAFWGGPGFGGMMGAVLHHARVDEA